VENLESVSRKAVPSQARRNVAQGRRGQATSAQLWASRGPAMWAELHRWALGGCVEHGQQWLEQFSRRIPCGECKLHWRRHIKQAPADFSSAEALFEWTVEAHNGVNRRLGKPEMAADAAKVYWASADAPAALSERASIVHPHSEVARAVTDIIRVDCIHALPVQREGHVACRSGRYGGAPSLAECRGCPARRSAGLGQYRQARQEITQQEKGNQP
jgi:Erv1 / Alr family